MSTGLTRLIWSLGLITLIKNLGVTEGGVTDPASVATRRMGDASAEARRVVEASAQVSASATPPKAKAGAALADSRRRFDDHDTWGSRERR
jgi:hypothetical protein